METAPQRARRKQHGNQQRQPAIFYDIASAVLHAQECGSLFWTERGAALTPLKCENFINLKNSTLILGSPAVKRAEARCFAQRNFRLPGGRAEDFATARRKPLLPLLRSMALG